ncbi:MAG: tetratricopeptide repeat protein [Spirochaetes bacterium]|nr:tetratricopeptide repeat protein [Spirochaetota bacterium]
MKNFSAAILSVIVSFCAAALFPCAWSDDGPGPQGLQSFFDQSVVGDPLFKDFYPDSINGIAYMKEPPRVAEDAMLAEWQAYFKSAYKATLTRDQVKDTLTNYAAFSRYVQKDDASFRNYLAYMSEVNPVLGAYEAKRMESWQPITKEQKDSFVASFDGYYRKASAAMANEKSAFLALRYGFQSVRFAVLAEKYDDAITAYDTAVAKQRGSALIGYQALGYKARALYKKGDRTGALAYYLEIFDQCPPLIAQALQSMYLTSTKKEFDEYRSAQKSDHKKTTASFVWALLQKRDYSRETLEAVLATGPAQTKPEIILVRMIQLIEQEQWNEDRQRFTANGGSVNKYDDLIALCERAAATKGIRQPALWQAGGAYLSLLAGKTANAEKLLAQAASGKLSPAMKDQLHMLGTLLELQKNRTAFTASTESRFTGDLIWAGRMKGTSNPLIHDAVVTLAAQRFLAAKNIPRAILAFSAVGDNASVYLVDGVATDKDLETLENMLTVKPAAGTLDALHLAESKITKDEIICVRGMKALRRENFAGALKHFERLSTQFAKSNTIAVSLDSPPVKNNASHRPSSDKYRAACKTYDLSLADGARLFMDITEASSGTLKQRRVPGVAFSGDAALALGNLWYSLFLTTDHGTYASHASQPQIDRRHYPYHMDNEHALFPFGIIGITESMKHSYDTFLAETDNFIKAEHWYVKAMSAKDKETAARACLNIAITRGVYLSYDDGKDSWKKKETEYVATFNKKFKDTVFYKEVIDECPLLRLYQ